MQNYTFSSFIDHCAGTGNNRRNISLRSCIVNTTHLAVAELPGYLLVNKKRVFIEAVRQEIQTIVNAADLANPNTAPLSHTGISRHYSANDTVCGCGTTPLEAVYTTTTQQETPNNYACQFCFDRGCFICRSGAEVWKRPEDLFFDRQEETEEVEETEAEEPNQFCTTCCGFNVSYGTKNLIGIPNSEYVFPQKLFSAYRKVTKTSVEGTNIKQLSPTTIRIVDQYHNNEVFAISLREHATPRIRLRAL